MKSLKINLDDVKFEKEVTLEDLTNDELKELIHNLVDELEKRTRISHVTIHNPYESVTVKPLTSSPYTYTCSAKDLATAMTNETEELL